MHAPMAIVLSSWTPDPLPAFIYPLALSIIAFHDNSSAIRGVEAPTLGPENPGQPSRMVPKKPLHHPILTAETHNFPTGVAPFNGAE